MTYAADALATFDNVLGTLDHLAAKAQGAGFADDMLGTAKLADDMFPLETQFRIAINQVLMALGRVWAMEIPLDETAYDGFVAVRAQLGATRGHCATAKSREAAPADTPVDYTLPNGMRFVMSSAEYIRDWTLPNFYFHARHRLRPAPARGARARQGRFHDPHDALRPPCGRLAPIARESRRASCGGLASPPPNHNIARHCEERSDEAIQGAAWRLRDTPRFVDRPAHGLPRRRRRLAMTRDGFGDYLGKSLLRGA